MSRKGIEFGEAALHRRRQKADRDAAWRRLKIATLTQTYREKYPGANEVEARAYAERIVT